MQDQVRHAGPEDHLLGVAGQEVRHGQSRSGHGRFGPSAGVVLAADVGRAVRQLLLHGLDGGLVQLRSACAVRQDHVAVCSEARELASHLLGQAPVVVGLQGTDCLVVCGVLEVRPAVGEENDIAVLGRDVASPSVKDPVVEDQRAARLHLGQDDWKVLSPDGFWTVLRVLIEELR